MSVQTPPLGLALGPYRLLRRLGAGGSGCVHLALDEQQEVAIKLVEHGLDLQADVDQVLCEAMLGTSIRHPAIVPCLGCGSLRGLLYLVYELMPGGDSRQLVERDGPLDEGEILRLMAEVAGGLSALHRAGYVHGDIKPSNILLDRRGRARIGDLGSARLYARSPEARVDGTLAFMAPEQSRGQALDPRADLYGLGATAYFWAIGRPPARPIAADGPAPMPGALRPGLSAGFDSLIAACLAPDRRQRYRSAARLGMAIAALRRGERPPPPRRSRSLRALAPIRRGLGGRLRILLRRCWSRRR